ncbi:MAG: heavy metal translocating P-type ATPase [Erysipelotrichaceae bacterium]
MMELNYQIEHLDCANCANKIETKISQLKAIQEVNLNFMNKKLLIICSASDVMQVRKDVETIVATIEPDAILIELNTEISTNPLLSTKGYITYQIKGLDCANCAAKIEQAIRNIDEVSEAHVNFANGSISIKTDKEESSALDNKVIKIVDEIEPGCLITKSNQIDKDNQENNHSFDIFRLSAGFIFFLAGLYFKQYEVILFIIAFVISGGKVVLQAIRNVFHGQVWDENFLMSIATIGAFAIGDYGEGVAVMLFYEVGELFQSFAVNHSRKSIKALMNLRSEEVSLVVEEQIRMVDPADVQVGDIIALKAGERVALDGVLLSDATSLDTSALSGESLPKDIECGDEILAGMINLNKVVQMRVTRILSESSISRILELVQNAGNAKAPTEKFITKFARYYTPCVVVAALMIVIIPSLLGYGDFNTWLYRGLTFLVISCPCALVISIPLALFAGIGGASRKGILVKGGNYLEAIRNIDTIVFDKTGTLTKGIFKVLEIHGENQDEILELAAYGECFSSHPIATSIVKTYGKEIDKQRVTRYEEVSGKGISLFIDNDKILIGNKNMLEDHKIDVPVLSNAKTIVYVVKNNQYLGYIQIGDELKDTSKQAIKTLKKMGIHKLVMLSGDQNLAVEEIKNQLNLDEVYGELLPYDKVTKLEMLLSQQANGKKLAFVGDGINDAPVIARADIGFAMGGIGSDAAIEAADVVLMKDDLMAICEAIAISKKTKTIMTSNIVFALGVKLVVLCLSAFGYANMWWGVFADVGVTLLAIMNSMRALKNR